MINQEDSSPAVIAAAAAEKLPENHTSKSGVTNFYLGLIEMGSRYQKLVELLHKH